MSRQRLPRKRHLLSEFPIFETTSRLFQLAPCVKCRLSLLVLNYCMHTACKYYLQEGDGSNTLGATSLELLSRFSRPFPPPPQPPFTYTAEQCI